MIGHCKHGEFDLEKGCPECMRQYAEVNSPENIAKRIKESSKVNLPPGGLAEAAYKAGAEVTVVDMFQPNNIVKVQYYSETTEELSGREYTYYSVDRLNVGDIVIVPVRNTTGKAKVSAVDVPETEIASFKDKVKTIPAGSVGTTRKELEQIDVMAAAAAKAGAEVTITADLLRETELPTKQVEQRALIVVDPMKDTAVFALLEEACKLQEYAEAVTIKSDADIKNVTNDLTIIQQLKKRITEKQKEYLDPITQHVDAVRRDFNTLLAPLTIADKVTRDKIMAYRNAMKAAAEAEAEAARLRQHASEMEAKARGETAPANEPAPTIFRPNRYRSDIGDLGTVKTTKWEIEDEAKIPREYLTPDASKIGKVVRAGGSIPGIKTFVEESLRVNSRGG